MANTKTKVKHYRDEYAIKEFGKKVRALRKKKGMTIEQLANTVDIYVNQLARIERGESNTTISYIFKMAEIFGVPPSELLDFGNKEGQP